MSFCSFRLPLILSVSCLLAFPCISGFADADAPTSSALARAARLLELGDVTNAVELANAELRKDPENVDAHAFLARCYLTNSDTESRIASMKIDLPDGSISNERVNFGAATATPEYTDHDLNVPCGVAHMNALAVIGREQAPGSDARPGIAALMGLLKHPDSSVRTKAALALAQSDAPERVQALVEDLQRENWPWPATGIVQALGRTKSPDAFRALFPKFVEMDSTQGDTPDCRALLDALQNLPNPTALEDLKKQVGTGSPGVQRLAAYALVAKGDTESLAVVLDAALKSRTLPVMLIGNLGLDAGKLTDAHRAMITEALASSDDNTVDRALAICMRLRGEPNLRPALLKALDPADEQRTGQILAALGAPASEDVIVPLTEAMLATSTTRNMRNLLSRVLAETTTSARGSFDKVISQAISNPEVSWSEEVITPVLGVWKGWDDPQAAWVFVKLADNLAGKHTPLSSQVLDQAAEIKLGAPEIKTLLGWLSDSPPDSGRYAMADKLLDASSRRGSDPQIRAWAVSSLADESKTRVKTGMRLLYLCRNSSRLTDDEKQKVSALLQRLELEQNRAATDSQSRREIAQDINLCQDLLGRRTKR